MHVCVIRKNGHHRVSTGFSIEEIEKTGATYLGGDHSIESAQATANKLNAIAGIKNSDQALMLYSLQQQIYTLQKQIRLITDNICRVNNPSEANINTSFNRVRDDLNALIDWRAGILAAEETERRRVAGLAQDTGSAPRRTNFWERLGKTLAWRDRGGA